MFSSVRGSLTSLPTRSRGSSRGFVRARHPESFTSYLPSNPPIPWPVLDSMFDLMEGRALSVEWPATTLAGNVKCKGRVAQIPAITDRGYRDLENRAFSCCSRGR